MPEAADLLITHARVFTADPLQPWAEAVAVSGSRIAAVGAAADLAAWRGPRTRVVDGQGATLLPGIIDSHFHLLWGSMEMGDAALGGVNDLAQLQAVVRAHARAHPDSAWVRGNGLRYNVAGPDGRLTRRELDEILPDRPLVVMSYDVHTAWANTRALELAGRLYGGPVDAGSEIVMGADGTALGELREPGAYHAVTDLIPPAEPARQRALLRQGLQQAARLGLTSIHNMDGSLEQISRYAALEDAGELTLRVYMPFSVTPHTSEAQLQDALDMRRDYASEMVRGGAAKFFMDGVVESYTALLLDDYADRPGWRGAALYSLEHFTRMALACDRLGLQIAVHAVGDGAVRRTLDGFDTVRRLNGARDSRHRIEHIELVHPDDLPRFAHLGVIASMQPLHAPGGPPDPDPWPRRVGRDRWERSFAWQNLRQAGATLVFGSDWPVVSQDPLLGVQVAVGRQAWAEGLPDHRQTLEDTLLAYTRSAAYAEFQEGEKGMLRPGLLADMVLLSADLFQVPPERIAEARPVLTVVGGRVVHDTR